MRIHLFFIVFSLCSFSLIKPVFADQCPALTEAVLQAAQSGSYNGWAAIRLDSVQPTEQTTRFIRASSLGQVFISSNRITCIYGDDAGNRHFELQKHMEPSEKLSLDSRPGWSQETASYPTMAVLYHCDGSLEEECIW